MIGQPTFIKDAPHNLVHDGGCRKQSGSAMKNTHHPCRRPTADSRRCVRHHRALPSHELVSECADGHQAIAAIHQFHPDIILLDIAMPGPSGIEVARSVRQFDTRARILVLSSIDRKEIIEQAMHAGADGYLLKDFVLDELLCALSTVLRGERYLSPRIRHMEIDSTSKRNVGKLLTARQLEILRLVASGKTTKEIARNLSISPKTVEFHRSRLMERTGANDVTGLTRFALQNGVLC
jgi:DNA-binding NarL/FixJ family response regulator